MKSVDPVKLVEPGGLEKQVQPVGAAELAEPADLREPVYPVEPVQRHRWKGRNGFWKCC